MRKGNRVMPVLIATAVASAMVLAGCGTGEPEARTGSTPLASASSTPTPSPSPTTSAAAPEYSPEETAAIENAQAAVLKFYKATDVAFGDPENAGPTPFADVAIDPVRSSQRGQLGYYVKEGVHSTGSVVVEFAGVQSVKTKSNPEKFVYPKVYFDICVDVSGTDVVDSSGKSVVGEGPDRQVAVAGAYEEPGEGWFVEFLEYQDGGDACKR